MRGFEKLQTAVFDERNVSSYELDFDDLLLYWRHMMEEPALAAEVGARFDHVLVDEYQDTNALQAAILLRMKPEATVWPSSEMTPNQFIHFALRQCATSWIFRSTSRRRRGS